MQILGLMGMYFDAVVVEGYEPKNSTNQKGHEPKKARTKKGTNQKEHEPKRAGTKKGKFD